MRLQPLLVLFGFLAATPAGAAALPACAGPVEIDGGALLRVERNGVVILADGRALKLEGVRLADGNAPLAALSAWLKKRPLTLTALPPKEDRYDRVRGQLFAGKDWVQLALLRAGLARVEIAPDRVECAAELFAAEGQARAARTGLWALPANAIRAPGSLTRADAGTFQIVQGKVLSASLKNGRAYINFGADWRSDFTATVEHDDMANFRKLGVDPRAYAGQTIRVRGIVQWLSGPEIAVANPQSVEVVQ